MQIKAPGTPIGEISASQSIAGAPTSVAAFVDVFAKGPTDMAVAIVSFADFENQFGGLAANSEASYAIQQFYLNGGGAAVVVRVASANGLSLIGDPAKGSGLYALSDVAFNILCIPATMNLADNEAAAVSIAATALCNDRRAFYILDVPQHDKTRDNPADITAWLAANANLRNRSAAIYFPRVEIPDALNALENRIVAPGGTMAGIYARTDAQSGVWNAPAGTSASLGGVTKLEHNTTDAEDGVLNPLAINCLRNFPLYGAVCWGARTLAGADAMADDFKYIPVRRLALYIEESLIRGTQWAVFEPNAEPLWAQLRLTVGAFLQGLWQQGAFFGSTTSEAYWVICDATNNPPSQTQFVNITIGFAPERPAEFIVIAIQQAMSPAS